MNLDSLLDTLPRSKRARILFLAVPLALVLSMITALGFFRGNDSLLLDSRFRTRDSIAPLKVDPSIITVDWDEQSIEQLGRWPWSWDKHVRLVQFLNLYGARHIGFVDDHFSSRAAVTLSREAAAGLQAQLQTMSAQALPDNESELAAAMAEKANVALSADFFIPDEENALTKEEEASRRSSAEANRPPGRNEAIKEVERFAGLLRSRGNVLTGIEIRPPVAVLGGAIAGLGFNRVVFDRDGIVRRTPAMVTLGDKAYPSLAVAMAAMRYGCPQSDIQYLPGECILFPKNDSRPEVRIPIDDRGFIMVNWAGGYHETFRHIPFLFLAQQIAFFEGKKALQQADPSEGQGALFERALVAMAGTRMVSQDDAEIFATQLMDGMAAEQYVLAGRTYDDYLAGYVQQEDPGFFREVWNAVLLNNTVVAKLSAGDTPVYGDVLEEIGNIRESNLLRENFDQTMHFYSIGRIDEARPLVFTEPIQLVLPDSSTQLLTPLALADKSIFVGLTATALNALNPTPFEERYQMLGLQPNVFNTIVTGQFIKEQPFWSQYLYIVLYAFLTVGLVLGFSTLGQAVAALLLATAHVSVAWTLFSFRGLALPIVAPVATIGSGYVVTVIFRYMEERRERRKVRGLFAAMVSPEVLSIMEEFPDKFRLSGEKKDATMFSSDVSGFTTISEGVTAQELANILNIYLTPMSNIIMKYGGYVDKYEGDAIKAAYGVPLPDEDHPWKGACSALEQQEELKVIARMLLLKYGVKITARMGVNTGIVSVGNMGSEKKMQYTVMGDQVTLAEELEPINKLYESWIALGPDTARRSEGFVQTRHLDTVLLGKHNVGVYEALAWNRERYLAYWNDRPLPPLFVEGWLKMTPEKALGYHYYYQSKPLPESSMKDEIIELFTRLVPIAQEAIGAADALAVQEHREAMKEFSANIRGDWKAILEGWRSDLREAQNHPPSAADKDEFDKLIDTLDKRTTSFLKRCSFPAPEDRIAWALAERLKELLVNDMTFDRADLMRQQAELQGEIAKAMREFLRALASPRRSKLYHQFMADHCMLTEAQERVREIFDRGRSHYLKREWDRAEAAFREALTIIPEDGPSQKYIERVRKLRADPPAEDWDGIWKEE